MRFCATQIRKMWRSWLWATPLGQSCFAAGAGFQLTKCRATTHSDLLLRANHLNISTQVIHNASILTALGSTGLQMYNFGQTLSLPFYTETWTPDSWYDRLEENLRIGMHTLVLVDIKVREQSEENMAR